MSSNQDIRQIITSVGGETVYADLYIALATFGPQTISQLSRNAHVERTKIYRLLDEMQSLRLIETELHPKRNIIKAAPLSSLQPVIAQKQEELKIAEKKLPELESFFRKQTLNSPLTKVQFYRGQEGAKQMLWNQTKAEGETVSILYQNMQSHTGEDFFIRWANRCNERNLSFRSVVGDDFIESQKSWRSEYSSQKLQHWQGRYIPKSVHEIRFWTCIYNDVIAYFNWHENEVYGIEIYNQAIADANRSFFESLWKAGKKLT